MAASVLEFDCGVYLFLLSCLLFIALLGARRYFFVPFGAGGTVVTRVKPGFCRCKSFLTILLTGDCVHTGECFHQSLAIRRGQWWS
ncbi:hypothetical protein IAD21_05573 [Abditibacteriota bacterium]|nr:hypothetical protein IAD21_05573 [Abditibacteriota bacterium]